MNKTDIEWADYSWNPIVGCSPTSEGCDHCYAAAISRRFKLPWGEAHFMPERLGQPAAVRKPSRIFVCSMGDFFHPTVRREWKEAVYKVIGENPRHTFILLTKRPEHILSFWADYPNIWLGVTAENQARADERIPHLLRVPAAVRFVSVEPMLGPVDLSRPGALGCDCLPQETGAGETEERCSGNCAFYRNSIDKSRRLDWVIAGPETGPGARQCDPCDISDLADQCSSAGVPFFDKRTHFLRRQFPKGAAQ
jgi:protein gp37